MNRKETHLFQIALNNALNYWLYNSITTNSIRDRLFRHHVSNNNLLDVARYGNKFGIAKYDESLHKMIHVELYAEILASFYEVWGKNIPCCSDCVPLPCSKSYDRWFVDGGRNSYYKPVHNLRELLQKRDEVSFFQRALIHGSIATLDDALGFSDLDLAFIVNASILQDPGKLIMLRGLAAEILTISYSFDPFMHHGPYYVSSIDLKWYPEALFPTILFGYGVEMLDNPDEMYVGTRTSSIVTEQMLGMFENFFEKWPSNPFILKDSFDLEWVLSSTMLLPALYLQQKTGNYRYKRETFSLAEKDFSAAEWEPVRTATFLRANLPPRPRLPGLFARLSGYMRWPGLLQSIALRHPENIRRAEKAVELLGPDYPVRVLRLIRAMNEKLTDSHRN